MPEIAYFKIHAPYGPYARRYSTPGDAASVLLCMGRPSGFLIRAYTAANKALPGLDLS